MLVLVLGLAAAAKCARACARGLRAAGLRACFALGLWRRRNSFVLEREKPACVVCRLKLNLAAGVGGFGGPRTSSVALLAAISRTSWMRRSMVAAAAVGGGGDDGGLRGLDWSRRRTAGFGD